MLISAPAGYGKTTLLADWLRQFEQPVAWLSLDQDDNDISRFLQYVITALKSILPDIRVDLLPPQSIAQSAPKNDLVSSLINEISTTSQDILLVLDDYHTIVQDAIHQTLMYLLDNCPPNLHIVIVTRTDPPVRIANLRAKGQLCELRAGDLQFSLAEAVDYFSNLKDCGVNHADIEALVRKTEGWIAGLQLAVISLRGYEDKHVFIRSFAGDDHLIADYLLEEVLNSLPESSRQFLLETSILDRMCASLCQAVTGREDSQEILETLGKANIFLTPLDNRRNWYRYHHLFQDLLYQRLKQRNPADQINKLHRLASEWLQASDFIIPAIHHAFEADDMLRVARLVESDIYTVLERGELAPLARRLDAIPAEYRGDRPWLNIALAWIYVYAGDLISGENTLQMAEESLAQLPEAERNRAEGHIDSLYAYIFWIQEQGQNAILYSQQSLALLPEDELSMRAFATTTLGGAFIQCDKFSEAVEAKQKGMKLASASGDSHVYVLAAGNLAYLYLLLGQLRKAELVCQDTFSFFEENGIRQPAAIGQIYAMLSTVYLHKNGLDQALHFAEKAVGYSIGWAQADTLTVCYLSLLEALSALQNYTEARRMISQVRYLSHYSPWFKLLIESHTAELNLAAGDTAEASRWVAESGIDYRDEVPEPERTTYRVLVKVLLAEGKLTEADHLIDRLIADSEKSKAIGYLISTLPIKSVIQLNLGNLENALMILARAFEFAESEGHVRDFINLGQPMRRLLHLAIDQHVHPDYARLLLSEMDKYDSHEKENPTLRIEGKSQTSIKLVDQLSQRELEVLNLISEGFTNQEIAQEFFLSIYTVKSHARNIFSKLGVKNRTEAVAKARRMELLPRSDD